MAKNKENVTCAAEKDISQSDKIYHAKIYIIQYELPFVIISNLHLHNNNSYPVKDIKFDLI